MLKLVLFGALLAIVAAAPQYPLFPGYHPFSLYSPFPYVRNPVETVPYPFAHPYYPYAFPYVPYYPPIQPTPPADQPESPAQPPVPTPAKTQGVVPVVTPSSSRPPSPYASQDKGELSIETAKLYLTPEQQVLFDAAVAAMNPLEYAAQLDTFQHQQNAKSLGRS